jgi:hypothetical protein
MIGPAVTQASTSGTVRADSTCSVWIVNGPEPVSYVTSTVGIYVEAVILDDIDLTDWRGLTRWKRGFEGVGRVVHRVYGRKVPVFDWRGKRKDRIQRLMA